MVTGLRPSYDAFGWLVWGREVLHGHLNTDGAPTWKPLTFLFTLPYALLGRNPQMWLWMLTSTASALAGSVFAGRIAYRLAGPAAAGRWPGYLAGALTGIALLGMEGYSQLIMIASSDPMVVTICLAAVESHLSGRRRLAFALLALASLGRPEAWAIVGPYGLWLAWRGGWRLRGAILAALLLIPLAWFIPQALTSHSWLGGARFDMNLPTAIHGNKVLGVLDRLRGIYELPMQIAVGLALLLVAVRRDRRALAVAAAAAVWVVVEIAFALHGFSAVARYLLEPAAVLIALTGGVAGWLLATRPPRPVTVRVGAVAGLLVLGGTLVPAASSRVADLRAQVRVARHASLELSRLQRVVAREGRHRIKSCGQPVTLLGYQSELAWVIDLNVGNVGFRPGRSIRRGDEIVLLKPHDDGWQVRPYNLRLSDRGRCASLRTDSRFGPA